MAFRDDNEALHAKVAKLQRELGEAQATVAKLQGEGDCAKPELLPKLRAGFKRRVRTLHGTVDSDTYERVVQMLQSGARHPVQTGLVGRILTAKSRGFDVTIMPGEGDELLLVFDEEPPAYFGVALLLFLFTAFAALGAALDISVAFGLVVLLVGGGVSGVALEAMKQRSGRQREHRDKLFSDIGGFLERRCLERSSAERSSLESVRVEFEEAAKQEESDGVGELKQRFSDEA